MTTAGSIFCAATLVAGLFVQAPYELTRVAFRASAERLAEGADPGEGLLLIQRGLAVRPIDLVEIGSSTLVHLRGPDRWQTVQLSSCIALLDPEARDEERGGGMLLLADGQRLPGRAVSDAAPDAQDKLAWDHDRLGRMLVELDEIRFLRLHPDAPMIEPGDADQVLLANGDRLEGFVVSLGDPISIEVDTDSGTNVVDVPLDRAAAVAMVTPQRRTDKPRLWLRDGTA
ncbi:MAG: hypothetical protein ACYTGC_18435, partial [Planctomycetota bacterium]